VAVLYGELLEVFGGLSEVFFVFALLHMIFDDRSEPQGQCVWSSYSPLHYENMRWCFDCLPRWWWSR
jgi:hypothetical protein